MCGPAECTERLNNTLGTHASIPCIVLSVKNRIWHVASLASPYVLSLLVVVCSFLCITYASCFVVPRLHHLLCHACTRRLCQKCIVLWLAQMHVLSAAVPCVYHRCGRRTCMPVLFIHVCPMSVACALLSFVSSMHQTIHK